VSFEEGKARIKKAGWEKKVESTNGPRAFTCRGLENNNYRMLVKDSRKKEITQWEKQGFLTAPGEGREGKERLGTRIEEK